MKHEGAYTLLKKAPNQLKIMKINASVIEASVMKKRFEWVTAGSAEGPRHPFDVDLLGLEGVVVTPTVGALLPEWLLVVPRHPAYCIADLQATQRDQVIGAANIIKRRLGDATGIFLFEHGARTSGSVVGCGADQAHLHVVKLPFNLISAVLDGHNHLNWQRLDNIDPWGSIDSGIEYFLVSDFNTTYVAYPEKPESQFFRKIVAQNTARSNEWDYRVFDNERNARATTRLFSK